MHMQGSIEVDLTKAFLQLLHCLQNYQTCQIVESPFGSPQVKTRTVNGYKQAHVITQHSLTLRHIQNIIKIYSVLFVLFNKYS